MCASRRVPRPLGGLAGWWGAVGCALNGIWHSVAGCGCVRRLREEPGKGKGGLVYSYSVMQWEHAGVDAICLLSHPLLTPPLQCAGQRAVPGQQLTLRPRIPTGLG